MKRCDYTKVSFIQPILHGLKASGIHMEPILDGSGLNAFNLKEDENYLPFPVFDKLIEQIERQQGLHNIADEFQHLLELTCLGEWGSMLLTSSLTMLDLCRKAEKAPDIVFTNEQIRIRVHGKITKYEQWFVDPAGPERTQLIHINAALMLHTFKLFLGEDWEPREIHFQSWTALDLTPYFPNAKNTKVYTGMPSTGLVLDTDLLNRKYVGHSQPTSHLKSEFSTPLSFTDHVETLISSTRHGVVPTIQQVSVMLDIPERSLRRALAQESTTYAELVDQWRCHEALKKVADPRFQIEEISEYLGYTNASNFYRAFKRWTDYTPAAYRDLECL